VVPDGTLDTAAGTPDEPSGAALRWFFGDRVDLARAFTSHLADTGVSRGLLGPREVPRLWSRHVLNCAAVAALVPADAQVVDVGSGAGLPGVVLALARPDLTVTLVEPLLRRVSWLEDVVGDLGLDSVSVVRGRAEELRGCAFDVATARAVAALDRLAVWCLPLLREGGVLLALKGRSAAEELAQAEPTLHRLGAVSWGVREVGSGVLDEPTTVVEVHQGSVAPTPAKGRTARGGSASRSRS
jgi:16S rRNA (guanine527-N7)-methyltransferase